MVYYVGVKCCGGEVFGICCDCYDWYYLNYFDEVVCWC